MPFSLLPGEVLLHEVDISIRASVLSIFSSGSSKVKVTNLRLVETHDDKFLGISAFGGGEKTTYAPLEMIDSMSEGRSKNPRLIWSSLILFALGILFTATLIGAILGIPLIILGVIFIFLWLFIRKESVIIRTSGEKTMEIDTAGSRRAMEDLVATVELARVERVHSLADL